MAESDGLHQVHLRAGETPKCDICAAKLETQLSKCLDCNLYICEACTLNHKNVPSLKNHIIIARVERELNKISNVSKLCFSHPNDEVIYYCLTCNVLICSECVLGNHRKHELAKIKTFAREKQKSLKRYINNAENEDVPKLTQEIEDLKESSKINDKNMEDNLEKIQNRITKITSELEEFADQIKDEIIKSHRIKKDEIEKRQKHLTNDVSEIQTMCHDFTKIYNTGSDIEVIRAEQEIVEKLNYRKVDESTAYSSEVDLQSFIEGRTDSKILKFMLGYLQPGPKSSKADVEVIKQSKHKSEIVQSICPLPDNTAFIHYYGLDDNDIITVDGKLQQTIKFDYNVVDFIMTSQGYILSTAGSEPKICKLTKERVKSEIISTAPLIPLGICESRDGSVLVSLIDERSYDIKCSSRRLVSRITMEGKVLQRYEYNKELRLFTYPYGVSENINGDVCVVNRTTTTTGHLVILDNCGQLKCKYDGKQVNEEFCPLQVKCDSVGNILVNDIGNRNVQMLNSQYLFVRYVITENKMSDSPFSLAVDNKTGVLWVGGNKGYIYTLRYLKK